MKYRGFVISHTHWDREWYLPFEQYRIRLQRLVEELTELMEEDSSYKYFMLDGQTVIMEDIQETFPEYAEKLKKLMKKGRILAGPWYTLPDEFLISGESLIRNYLYGLSVLNRLSITPMNIAYLPDMFGHSAYIPTVVASLGMKEAVIWRGIGDKSRKTEFIWKGPDGSEVLTESLIATYSNLKRLPEDYKGFKECVLATAKSLIPHLTTTNILFMNGTDHEFPYRNLSNHLKIFNEESSELELLHSNLPQFFKEIHASTSNLKTVEGEFRCPKYEHILKDISSSRIYLKQSNHLAESLLTRYLEPLLAYTLIDKTCHTDDLNYLDYLWKLLLKNHAHDSIGGCSTDRVHQEVETRFSKVIDGAQMHIARTLSQLIKETDGERLSLLVYNPTEKRVETIEKEIIMPPDFSGFFKVFSEDGEEIDSETEFLYTVSAQKKGKILFQREGLEYLKHFSTTYTQYLKDLSASRYKITFRDTLESFGFKKYVIKPIRGKNTTPHILPTNEIETKTLKIRINEDGSLFIKDKRTNITYPHIHFFEDEGDAGDEYNFSPPKNQKIVSTTGRKAEVTSIKEGKYHIIANISYNLLLPKSLSPNRATRSKELIRSQITSTIKIHKNSPRIDFLTSYRNEALDHRLRVWFQTPIVTDENHAADYFGHVTRENQIKGDFNTWTETPSETYPMHGHAFITDAKNTFILLSKGLPEYATRLNERKEVALGLTLLRAVGWLSRDDLLTRKEHAGPPIATPEAQCLRKFHYEYSIYIGNEMSPVEIYKEANRYIYSPLCMLDTDFNFSTKRKLFEINGNCLVSSIKVNTRKTGIIIRIFNPHKSPEDVYLKPLFQFKQLNILNSAEVCTNPKERASLKNGTLSIKLKPHEIKTIGFTL